MCEVSTLADLVKGLINLLQKSLPVQQIMGFPHVLLMQEVHWRVLWGCQGGLRLLLPSYPVLPVDSLN